jgi:hypothetical protein
MHEHNPQKVATLLDVAEFWEELVDDMRRIRIELPSEYTYTMRPDEAGLLPWSSRYGVSGRA